MDLLNACRPGIFMTLKTKSIFVTRKPNLFSLPPKPNLFHKHPYLYSLDHYISIGYIILLMEHAGDRLGCGNPEENCGMASGWRRHHFAFESSVSTPCATRQRFAILTPSCTPSSPTATLSLHIPVSPFSPFLP